MSSDRPGRNDPCSCGSGRKYRQCCWLHRFEKPVPSQEGPYESCPCGSGKPYKRCCYPRTFPDLTKPNAGIEPHLERAAFRRAISRFNSRPAPKSNLTIDTVDVGHTRLECAPLPPCGADVSMTGTLAPPTPLQIEAKYDVVREANPEGFTEVVVNYNYPETFGFAEARMLFDADDSFPLTDGRVINVLDLLPGMQIRMSDGSVGTITSDPECRTELPLPPLPLDNGLWSSRVIGQVKHTAYEMVEFRWAGQQVEVTPGHLVWSEDRQWWIRAHELIPGELVRVAGNVVAPVEGRGRRKTGPVEVYGIEVEYFHNYFVGTGPDAMLVHNGECIVKPAEVNGRKVNLYDNVRPDDVTVVGRKPGFRLEERDGKWVTVSHKRDGTEVVFTANGTYHFVVQNGNIRVIRPQELSSHTALAGAGPVEYAGRVKFGSSSGNRGQIQSWDNGSGHFLPRTVDAPQAGLPMDRFRPHPSVGAG